MPKKTADAALTDAELNRAYARGYGAGRRKGQHDAAGNQSVSVADQFWRDAMVAALPFAMTQGTWSRTAGDLTTPINSLADRVLLASEVADSALSTARKLGRVQ